MREAFFPKPEAEVASRAEEKEGAFMQVVLSALGILMIVVIMAGAAFVIFTTGKQILRL